MTRYTFMAAGLVLGFAVHAAELRNVVASPAGEAISVDGALGEECWRQGEWAGGFSFLDMPDRKPDVQTSFKVRFDDQAIYVGIRAQEPTPDTMKLNSRTRDLKVWSDDCVEIMLDPTGERIEYYHIMVNALGTVYDAQMRQGGNVRSVEWDCNVEAATDTGADFWSAECRLPLVELGLNASSAGDWAINVTRARRAQGTELSSFAPLTGGFHQPSLFAALKMQGGDFSRFLWDIKPPYDAMVMPEGGGLVYTARLHIRNGGKAFRFFKIRGLLRDSAGRWVADGLDSGQGREYSLRVPLKAQGKQTLTLELVDRHSGAPLALRRSQVELSYTPIALDVRKPWYRNSIYATESVESIECIASISLPVDRLDALVLKATLQPVTPPDAPAEPITERILSEVHKQVAVSLPIPELSDGDYTLTASLLNRLDGKTVHTASTTIHKLPGVPHEWRLDERNVLRYNGQEILPFGWFSIPVKAMAEEGHAYRLMQHYNAQYKRSREEIRAYLDTIVAAGSHVTIYPYPSANMMRPASVWGQPLSTKEAEALRNRLNDISDHAGVFAWYLADEPELRPALPERMRAIYETCVEADPYHPCIMLNDTIAGIFKYVDGGDILMPDPYPCFIKGGLAAQPIEKTSKFIKACREAGKGRKAIWITPQAFNYGDYGRKNQRGPTAVELRNQLYQAVVYGAKGFLWYTYSHTANYPDLDLGMRWLSFEVADLKARILADPCETTVVTVKAPHPEHVHVSPRRVNGQLTLFAVNTATTPQQVVLTLGGAGAQDVRDTPLLHVVSEGRAVALGAGLHIHDRFDVYQTHIYTTDASLGSRPTFADLCKRIAAADAARKRPGNLAFEDVGTWVEISSKSRYGSTPERVLDGVRNGMVWRADPAAKGNDWLAVRWPRPQRLARAVIYSHSVSDCSVQVPDENGWRTVGTVKGNREDRIEVPFEAVATAALRILVNGLRPDQKSATIWEVEAYAK